MLRIGYGGPLMQDWIDGLARALGEDPLSPEETARLLETARDVAHRTERRLTPLTTFLIGVSTGRALAAGATRTEATGSALETLGSLLPPSVGDGGGGDLGDEAPIPEA